MAYMADRQCDRCDAGMECLRSEAGGMRPYESYWHYLDGLPDDQAWVECFKSEDDKVDGLLAEADYYEGVQQTTPLTDRAEQNTSGEMKNKASSYSQIVIPKDNAESVAKRFIVTEVCPVNRKIVRVEQRNGRDCLRCCVAMVTGVDYNDVPDFCADHGDAWPTALNDWLSTLGMGLLILGKSAPEYVPEWLPVIAQGKTSRSSLLHFVVVTADSVIDPSPYQTGLTEITDRYIVVNSGALANGFIEHLGKKYAETVEALRATQDTKSALRGHNPELSQHSPASPPESSSPPDAGVVSETEPA